jgi:hypothetical protein
MNISLYFWLTDNMKRILEILQRQSSADDIFASLGILNTMLCGRLPQVSDSPMTKTRSFAIPTRLADARDELGDQEGNENQERIEFTNRQGLRPAQMYRSRCP